MIPELFNAADYFIDRNLRERRGGNVAIECGSERVTYDRLCERVNRFGNALRERLDVRLEERVVLLLLDGPAFAYAFFGAIKAGAVPIPVNTLWKPQDYVYVLNDSRARVLVVSPELLPQIDQLSRRDMPFLAHIVVAGEWAGHLPLQHLLDEASPILDPAPTRRDDQAFWLYSSGSTGFPKGCVHLQHDMFVCASSYARSVLGMTEADRCFSAAKLFFAYGLGNALYMPFAFGATTILWPGPPVPADVYRIIEAHRPTLFFSVPTGYAMMLAHHRSHARPDADAIDTTPDFDLSSIRCAISAGEALPPALFDRFKNRFGIEILDGIGSTETLHMFISNRPGRIRPGSSGELVPGYEARILDEDRTPVAPREIGNLYIAGDSICAGYWNQHEKTKQTIEGSWIRTGDKFWRDEEGYFWYAGRSDDMLKVGGQWVSPIEVENALAQHDVVRECAVVGREDSDGLVKPCAFVVLESDRTADPQLAHDLQQFVVDRLAAYKRPRWIEFITALPKTATGKIQRFKLREHLAQLSTLDTRV